MRMDGCCFGVVVFFLLYALKNHSICLLAPSVLLIFCVIRKTERKKGKIPNSQSIKYRVRNSNMILVLMALNGKYLIFFQ